MNCLSNAGFNLLFDLVNLVTRYRRQSALRLSLASAQTSSSWALFPSSKNRLDGSGRRPVHKGDIRYQRRWQNTYLYRKVQIENLLLEALAIEEVESLLC
jgi:hypothetical protein